MTDNSRLMADTALPLLDAWLRTLSVLFLMSTSSMPEPTTLPSSLAKLLIALPLVREVPQTLARLPPTTWTVFSTPLNPLVPS